MVDAAMGGGLASREGTAIQIATADAVAASGTTHCSRQRRQSGSTSASAGGSDLSRLATSARQRGQSATCSSTARASALDSTPSCHAATVSASGHTGPALDRCSASRRSAFNPSPFRSVGTRSVPLYTERSRARSLRTVSTPTRARTSSGPASLVTDDKHSATASGVSPCSASRRSTRSRTVFRVRYK